ncbi:MULTISPECIES: AraC family transcriptional regulator [unclassified Paenibacillus]|uniref:AraC family transcriptional regulator n=1 Tax=unclassified Paenibacillus TaxID=185978 RepID=UPI0004F81E06|nr:AraC family transcriptional regulator [Paenibacillus sp. FSL H7-0357]AIQ16562.1 hypothetical protein H70357_07635 [Paenibacillus sp. FSL H7-0357]
MSEGEQLNIQYEHEIPVNAFVWSPNTFMQPLHYHSSLEIGCCISGKGWFHFGENTYPVQVGDVFIVNHSELHIAWSDEEDPSTYIFLNFDPGLLLTEDERLLIPFCYSNGLYQNRIPHSEPLAIELRQLIERVRSELVDKQEGYSSMVKATLLHICTLLLRNRSIPLQQKDWQKLTRTIREYRKLMDYIKEHYTEALTLQEVAKYLGVSPSRASHVFLEATGRHFKDCLLQVRLNEAKRLLVNTSLDVTEVCFSSGFQSVSTFYRLFGSIIGLSPIEYRQQYQTFRNI